MAGPKRNYIQRTGKHVNGVTTILDKVLAKKALIPWGYKQGIANYYRLSEEVARILNLEDLTANQKLDVILDYIVSFEIGKLYDKRDAAARAGTLGHAYVENYIRKLPEPDTAAYTKEAVTKAEGCFLTFLDWEKNHNVKIIASEVGLTSEQRPFGGTIDHIAETATSRVVPGAVEIIDIKTGKAIYMEAKIQVGTYEALYLEKHPEAVITGDHILRLGDDGEFTHQFFPTLRPYFEAFKALLYAVGILEGLGERL